MTAVCTANQLRIPDESGCCRLFINSHRQTCRCLKLSLCNRYLVIVNDVVGIFATDGIFLNIRYSFSVYIMLVVIAAFYCIVKRRGFLYYPDF